LSIVLSSNGKIDIIDNLNAVGGDIVIATNDSSAFSRPYHDISLGTSSLEADGGSVFVISASGNITGGGNAITAYAMGSSTGFRGGSIEIVRSVFVGSNTAKAILNPAAFPGPTQSGTTITDPRFGGGV
jgi:hypothetical protein